jgi:hypothetical protein
MSDRVGKLFTHHNERIHGYGLANDAYSLPNEGNAG